jgi:hypothetical protein
MLFFRSHNAMLLCSFTTYHRIFTIVARRAQQFEKIPNVVDQSDCFSTTIGEIVAYITHVSSAR